jgi:hypothetical protein
MLANTVFPLVESVGLDLTSLARVYTRASNLNQNLAASNDWSPQLFLLHADPPLFQHVFTEIYDLLKRFPVVAEFNSNAECFSNERSIRVVNYGFRERSIVQCIRAMPRRKKRLCRTQVRVVVGIKKMPLGKYLDLLRLPNGLLFTVVNGGLNLPDSFEGGRLSKSEVRSE